MKIVITITRKAGEPKKIRRLGILRTLILKRLDKTLGQIRTDFNLKVSRKVTP